MNTTQIYLHSKYQIGKINPRIFGGFIEHMGRAVYQGLYDPNSFFADEDDFRKDVLMALQKLNLSVVRYPGGNFASGYHWLDGIGPTENRPSLRELAWNSLEPNLVGTDEFLNLCRKMNWEPMLTVNLGSGSIDEANNWLEYCNSPVGTKYSNLRAINGNDQPYKVKLWCLGNEMDGSWQIGHLPADQYALRARQTAKTMKVIDPSIELIACGSSGIDSPTYLEWDRQVLEVLGDCIDYLSFHRYVGNYNNDTNDYLAITMSIEQQIISMQSVCDFVKSKFNRKKKIYLCLDEWNVCYKNTDQSDGHGQFAPNLAEEVYNLEDALVVSGFFHCILRHVNIIKIANLSQLVNVIAPIKTNKDNILLQSIYYIFEMFSRRGRGISLKTVVEDPGYESIKYGKVNFIDASVLMDNNQLHIFITNRNQSDTHNVEIQLCDHDFVSLHHAEILTGDNPKASNSFENPYNVISSIYESAVIQQGKLLIIVPPLAFVAITCQID